MLADTPAVALRAPEIPTLAAGGLLELLARTEVLGDTETALAGVALIVERALCTTLELE